ncbi:hemolysin family protein [Sorangium sp. So ce185]|uniref:hemolysin family protein n=1 Tax=Sorangium sp. So ce185 TaxID=3133287 RepID=UPI003F643E42
MHAPRRCRARGDALCPRSASEETIILSEILIILALVLVNGIFAGAEIAVVTVRKTRLDQLIQSGSRRARAVKRLRGNPERFLATVQIGITIVGATASAFGGSTLAQDLAPLLRAVPWIGDAADELALAAVVALVSFLSLVLGELVPKSLALRSSERYALLVGPPLRGLASLARPLVWLLTATSNLVLRLFGDRTNFVEARISPEEIQQIVDDAAEAGSVDRRAGEIASRALDFAGLTALQVMLPRVRVVAIPREATAAEVQRAVLEHGHTRMPVYEGSNDNVIGYVTTPEVLALLWGDGPFSLESVLRPAYFVVASMPAVDLLAEMKRRRLQLAIVVDEQGGMIGIVTMEDLVEELVGEIFAENEAHALPTEGIRREPDGSALVPGDMPVHELSRQLEIELPDDARWSTVAGLCMGLARRIPAPGDVLRTPAGAELHIVDASPRQIRTVRVRVPLEPAEREDEEQRDAG